MERGFVFFGQLLHCFAQRGDGAFLELADADVAVARLDQFGAHALHFDDGAGEFEGQRFGRVFARNGQFDVGAGFAAHLFHRFAHAHAACRNAVDFRDVVAAFDAGTFGRGVFNRSDDFDKAVFGADFHPQTAEFAACAFLQVGIVFFVHVFGMRVEIGHHAFRGAFEQDVVGFVFVVVGFNLTVNLCQRTDGLYRQRVLFFALGGGETLYADGQQCAAERAQCVECDLFQSGICHVCIFSFVSECRPAAKMRTVLDLMLSINCFYQKIQ